MSLLPPLNHTSTGVPIPYSKHFIDSLNVTEQNYVLAHCNTTICELSYASVHYDPSLGGNLLFLILFTAILFIQFGLGIWYKTWTYLLAMTLGLVLEVVGYDARVQMSHNPWLSNPFLIYIVCLTVAPVFFTANLYVSFMRCLPLYDPSLTLNRLRPKWYIIVFIASDLFSLILQSLGGAIADISNTQSTINMGVDIMIGGLAFQVVSLGIFVALCADFTWKIKKFQPGHKRHPVTNTWRMKGFVWSIIIASTTIIIRSIFRSVELSGGFNGKLANSQTPFMIFEPTMMAIAIIALTCFHPGFAMGSVWHEKLTKTGSHTRINSGVDVEGLTGGAGGFELGAPSVQSKSYVSGDRASY